MAAERKLGEGREAEVFAWEDGRILRLLRDPGAIEQNQAQASALRAIKEAGGPAPGVYGIVTVDGRPGLIMERINGPSLLGQLAGRPWTIRKAARLMAKLHLQMHAIAALPETPSVHEKLGSQMQSKRVPSDLSGAGLSLLEQLPTGDRVCHGDFHPDNIMISDGGAIVIDWTNVAKGNPHADVARTLVIGRWGIPPEAPLTLRLLAKGGRRLLLREYLSVYQRSSPLNSDLLNRWRLVGAIARLAEAIPGEEARISAWARRRLSEEKF